MSNLHTDDNFMYHNCRNAEQASWENQLLDDYETPKPRSSVETDPLVYRITHQRGPKVSANVQAKTKEEEALEKMVENAEELDLYDDEIVHDLTKPLSQQIDNDPMKKQVNGNHYNKYPIQPAEYCYKNGLNNLQSEAISYITRYPDKGGKVDLEKAIHTLEILIHMEYGDGNNG